MDGKTDSTMTTDGLRIKDKVAIVTGGCKSIVRGCVDVFDSTMTTDGLRFKDKVAIVTGGCKGIGKGCVDVFVQNGGKVAIFDIDESTGEGLVGKSGRGEIYFVRCDTRIEDQIKSAVQETAEKYGQIDCLVNNAGWHPPPTSIDDQTAEQFNSLLQLNLTGYFMCCKYSLPYLRKTKGSIINISSVTKEGQGLAVAYAATKGGISSMTKALAIDEAMYGVRINEITPGSIRTPMYESFIEKYGKTMDSDSVGNTNLFGRPGESVEVGQACLYLAADATYCTATDITVSAGMELGGWK